MKINNNNRGFGLVEALVGIGIFSAVLLSLIIVFQNITALQKNITQKTQAQYLLEEEIEAIRSIRDDDWSQIEALVAGTSYEITFSTSTKKYSLQAGTEEIDDFFNRWVVLENVNRNGSDDISDVGSVDAGTKKVTAYVSWSTQSSTTTKELSAYISDILSE